MSDTARTAAVLGGDGGLGADLVSGMTRAGCAVVSVADHDPVSGAAVAHAIQAAAPAGVSAVIDAGLLREPPSVTDLAALDHESWVRTAESPLRRALHVLQGAHSCLRADGGRVVVLLPSLVMTGAAGVAGWVAAAEGYRSLAKAAARAWGPECVSIQCVLVPASLASGSLEDRPGLQPPALGQLPDATTDIAPLVAALLDERFDVVTGLTLAVDGGVWMTS